MPDHWWVELGPGPLVRKARSRGVSRGGSELKKSLDSLSADWWGCISPIWLFGLNHPALAPTNCWVGPELGVNDLSQMSASSESSCRWILPKISTTLSIPQSKLQLCPSYVPRRLPRPAGKSGPGSYEVTALAINTGTHEILCTPFKSEASFSPVLWNPCNLSPTGLQSQIIWGLLFLTPNPQVAEIWDSELLLLWENLCNTIIL